MKKNSFIGIRVSPELKEIIVSEAKKRNMSISDFFESLVTGLFKISFPVYKLNERTHIKSFSVPGTLYAACLKKTKNDNTSISSLICSFLDLYSQGGIEIEQTIFLSKKSGFEK